MNRRHLNFVFALGTAAAMAGCGHASADQAAQAAADSARAEGAPPAEVTRRADQARATVVASEARQDRIKARRDSAKAETRENRTRTIASGTALRLVAVTDISSRTDKTGDAFVARTTAPALTASGDTVIPVGAEFVGRVTALNPAPTPSGHGTLTVAFNSVRFGGESYPVSVNVTSLGTRTVARGVTVEDAAKVGVGAAAGAVAGRIIGHNRGSAAGGAVVGGAAGAIYANRTKDHDIVLSPGSSVEVVLTDAFTRQVASNP